MTRKRIEITLKVSQTLVIRNSLSQTVPWCSECAAATQMLTPDEAAVVSDTSTRAIYRLLESGRLHFVETENGLVLVCFNSLPDSVGVIVRGGV